MKTYITGGTLVTPHRILPNHTLAIQGEKIIAIGSNEMPIEPDEAVISANGYWITPGFIDVHARSLIPHYGVCGSLWRLGLLSVLHYTPLPDEAYIDGVAVDPAYRGQRIGTDLIRSAERWARRRGLSLLSLEVVDSNPRARRLYHRIGFEVVQEKTAWPVGSIFGFQSSAKMVKLLDGTAIDYR